MFWRVRERIAFVNTQWEWASYTIPNINKTITPSLRRTLIRSFLNSNNGRAMIKTSKVRWLNAPAGNNFASLMGHRPSTDGSQYFCIGMQRTIDSTV